MFLGVVAFYGRIERRATRCAFCTLAPLHIGQWALFGVWVSMLCPLSGSLHGRHIVFGDPPTVDCSVRSVSCPREDSVEFVVALDVEGLF